MGSRLIWRKNGCYRSYKREYQSLKRATQAEAKRPDRPINEDEPVYTQPYVSLVLIILRNVVLLFGYLT